ncbi:MAG TPA: hypothetical protein DDX39_12800 [Bacteroidales bacterium]|nr:MAG: hypothetical protein A2W98_02540 [Bacteroidetes bacterium GWF2_33_38]OFY74122.1 MAG: hypothetical protein A2265_05390 [Bacteroidetes bacterium RIFOXYA12_FULL_33_9]HBF89511.1 hypothetical protein [Bacteroidales bacterium]
MNINKQYKGIFWIPGEEKNWKNGLLKFINGIAYVEIFGSFDNDPLSVRPKRRNEICCIHGRLNNSRFCILNNCQLHISDAFFLTSTINFEFLYFSSNQDLITKTTNFEKIEFKLDALRNWVNYNAFEINYEDNKPIGIVRRSEKIENNILYSDDNLRLSVNFSSSIPLNHSTKDYILEQETSLILEFNNQIETNEVFQFVDKVQDFLILMLGARASLKKQFLFSDGVNEYIHCYKNSSRFRNNQENKEIYDVIFSFNDLNDKNNICSFFNTWFSLYNNYEYPIELLIKCLSDISMNYEYKFINLMYALDVIQQKDVTNSIKDERQISAKNEKLIAKIATKFKDDSNTINELRTQLKKNDKIKLKDKLSKLLEPFSNLIESLFEDKFEDFITIVVNTRNLLTHESSVEPRLKNDEFYYYNLKLEAILLILFLEKLHLPLKDIEIKIKQHGKFHKVIKD